MFLRDTAPDSVGVYATENEISGCIPGGSCDRVVENDSLKLHDGN